jgi:hypothetical protein
MPGRRIAAFSDALVVCCWSEADIVGAGAGAADDPWQTLPFKEQIASRAETRRQRLAMAIRQQFHRQPGRIND